MHLDAEALKKFYLDTGLGRLATQVLASRVAEFWPSVAGDAVAGFGFASPLLEFLRPTAMRAIDLMPRQQGVMAWPGVGACSAVLIDETSWPLPTGFCERILVLHGLETSDNPSGLLDECWRVLAPEGRVLFIVPNRAGLWARRDRTPFGFGRPYSTGQLENQLTRHRFGPVRHAAALFIPPSERRFVARTCPAWERIGRRMPMGVAGGVLLFEATKRQFQPHRTGLSEMVSSRLKALEGIAVPGPEPVSGRGGA